eukprot:CAMPEP_0178423226 /NCGR_PEP_ID=MMETSP0689_2-20121128/27579_1 /TAXON_ID=160604 /ORGANISM="Amphidinium massartii, Strain CS-259" /LENGTH=54 /DNA_ID=CAMNT_0020044813 /DNA_START=474 /DNA_END=638 /DNA_ORIENTATION=-
MSLAVPVMQQAGQQMQDKPHVHGHQRHPQHIPICPDFSMLSQMSSNSSSAAFTR